MGPKSGDPDDLGVGHLARYGDEALYAGVRYLSRLGSQWECWTPFEDDECRRRLNTDPLSPLKFDPPS